MKELLSYIEHNDRCDWLGVNWNKGPCDCGLFGLLSAMHPTELDDLQRIRPTIVEDFRRMWAGRRARITESTTEAERVWHRSRRAIVFHNGELRFNDKGDERGHREWFIDAGWYTAYEGSVRGFIDETGVYLYQGEYMVTDRVRATAKHLIANPLWPTGVAAGLPVFGGMLKSDVIGRWEPLEKLGVTEALL